MKSLIGLIPLVVILIGVNAWRGKIGQAHFEYPEQLAGLTRMHDAAAREYEGRVSTTLCMWREDDNHGFVVMPGKSVDATLDTMFRVRGQLEA